MLKVAVIGCGNISGSHIKAYLEFPELCQITALCDIYPEKAEKRKAEFGLAEARIYASHEELLATNAIYREIYESQVQGGGDFDQPA